MSNARIQVEPIDPDDAQQQQDIKELQRQAIAGLIIAQSAHRYFQESFDTARFACRALLWTGILTGFVTIIIAIVALQMASLNAAVITAVLAALSATSFLGVYVLRPLDSLERNAMLVPLVASIMGSFWFRFALAKNDDELLKKISNDLVLQLGSVIDKHSAATAKYIEALSTKAPAEETEDANDEENGEKEDPEAGGTTGGKQGDNKHKRTRA